MNLHYSTSLSIGIQVSIQVPKSYQTKILNNHHDKFRKSLNFRSILPLLNQDGLIPHEEYCELLNIPQTDTNHDRIDRLFAIIPSCGRDDFLMLLIRCLRESAHDEAGVAHEELADSLQQALDSYVPELSDSPPRQHENVSNNSKENGIGFEIVDPESALISIEERGGGRSTLTVEHPNDREHTRQGSYELIFDDVILIINLVNKSHSLTLPL